MSEDNKEYRLLIPKPRSKKLRPRIDLTAMVSVSFLLIIFFMVTIEMSKPRMMDLGLPNDYGCGYSEITCGPHPSRVMTLLLDDDNKVIRYLGILEVPDEMPKKFDYGKNGIRKELMDKDKAIKKYYTAIEKNRGLIVIIKPSKKCNYGNLVDILDEMAISNINSYTIVNDYTPEEMKLLASN